MKTIERTQIILSSTLFMLLALILLMLMTSGCVRERIEGNYDLKTEERASLDFSEVHLKGSFNVTVIPDSVTRILVQAESNVLPYIYTISNGTTLSIGTENGYNIREHYTIGVFVHTPVLEGLRLSGSGTIESGRFSPASAGVDVSGSGQVRCEFNSPVLDAGISGSGNLYISGSAINSNLNVSGSGDIDALSLNQTNCKATISGSGKIKTAVSQNLDAWISGSGNIYYLGDPAVSSHISGSGRVLKY